MLSLRYSNVIYSSPSPLPPGAHECVDSDPSICVHPPSYDHYTRTNNYARYTTLHCTRHVSTCCYTLSIYDHYTRTNNYARYTTLHSLLVSTCCYTLSIYDHYTRTNNYARYTTLHSLHYTALDMSVHSIDRTELSESIHPLID